MSIQVNQEGKLFSLQTDHSVYQIGVDRAGLVRHLYYGAPTNCDMSYLIRQADRGFSGNPYDQQLDRTYSLDTLPQEYGTGGVGDYRTPSVTVLQADGMSSVDLRFEKAEVKKGKTPLEGMPSVRGDLETEGLEITLKDEVTGLRVILRYDVFPSRDVITRSASIENRSDREMVLCRAASAMLDFSFGEMEVLHFHGRHAMERMAERLSVPRGGSLTFESRRGMSSHQSNPFLILCDPAATERQGDCYGVMLVYSGNHLQQVERDQTGGLRVSSGIHPENFSWLLRPGERFRTPEVILSYSVLGLNGLSQNYHRILRERVIPPAWREKRRPVLLNSWEACYFDFDAAKILHLAEEARDLGLDMLVLDDGWFGERNDDTTSLGDWDANERKLGCSLGTLAEKIHGLGLSFGLWVEPEMISENSRLYQAHPDWAMTEPDRRPNVGRSQLVLDLGREDVRDFLYAKLCALVEETKADYLKWDFNRSLANFYSRALPAARQWETAHRFMLGTYRLLERLTEKYPKLMIEGCSGGGGRFDAGMLYYSPQIWCSDDTDAIERLEIQRGTSYGYPISAMGAHVSACPNHQTGRSVPFATRGVVAMAGTFGYELNPTLLSGVEKEELRRQLAEFRKEEMLIAQGDYYRLTELGEDRDFEAWMIVSPDRREAVLTLVMTHVRANGLFPHLRLEGLETEGIYELAETGEQLTGAALMYGGYAFPRLQGDYPALKLHLQMI